MKLSKVEVEEQLERILDSDEFLSSRRLSAFLSFLVTEMLADRADQLQAYTIAQEVFGRPDDFDPQLNAIVRVQAGQLRLRLGQYYSIEGENDPVRISIPKGAYIPFFSRYKSPENREDQFKPRPKKHQLPSVMVFPFANFTDCSKFDFFSVGLTGDVIAALECFPDILVHPGSAGNQYKDDIVDFFELAQAQGARFFLDGNVLECGPCVRVSARLLNAETRELLWHGKYTSPINATSLFGVEKKIAAQVAAAVAGPSGKIAKSDFLSMNRKSTDRIDAYDAVLRSYHYVHGPNEESHGQITPELEVAVLANPEYSDASAMLARMYMDQARFGFNLRSDPEEMLQKALAAANNALKYAPNNPMAWHQMCQIQLALGDVEQFFVAGERSILLSPNHPDVLAEYGHHLWRVGHCVRGLEMVGKARSLYSEPPGWYNFALVHDDILHRRFGDALEKAHQLNTLGIFWVHLLFAVIYGQLGDRAQAKASLSRMKTLNPSLMYLSQSITDQWIFPDGFVNHLHEGLAVAGLNIT